MNIYIFVGASAEKPRTSQGGITFSEQVIYVPPWLVPQGGTILREVANKLILLSQRLLRL